MRYQMQFELFVLDTDFVKWTFVFLSVWMYSDTTTLLQSIYKQSTP